VETDEGTQFDVFVRNTYFETFLIPMYGNHHILNALSVIAFCDYEGMESTIMQNLTTFGGVKRRFTEHNFGSQIIIDDYAHHPIECTAANDCVRTEQPTKRRGAMFQPHTYRRTAILLNHLATRLNAADHMHVCDIASAAREDSGDLTLQASMDL